MTAPPCIVRTHNGFGDVIFVRPVVAALADTRPVILATAWPQMFADLPVQMIRAKSGLTWSLQNMAEHDPVLAERPPHLKELDIRIRGAHRQTLRAYSMIDVFAKIAGVSVKAFSLPALPPSPVQSERIAVIRPATLRSDWPHKSRTPLPEYLDTAAELLTQAGYYVVSVASVSESEPYLSGPLAAHERFDRGELGPLELLALVKAASLVVTGPGWAVPAALACKTPLIVIHGGAGGTNGPKALIPAWYDGEVSCIAPKPLCSCTSRTHACHKTIPDFAERFTNLVQQEAAV